MSYINNRQQYLKIIDQMRQKQVSMALFCTASHWNTEAILLACSRFAKKWGIPQIPVGIGITFSYPYMAQAKRVTYSGDLKTGFLSIMYHLKMLCDGSDSPYACVDALPHLDHADPVRDKWALTKGISYLASVMFDAQHYSYDDNVKQTSDYVKTYGDRVLVEGIIDELNVSGNISHDSRDDYVARACEYIRKTKVDFLVADLGTEQQSAAVGNGHYLKNRAIEITNELGKPMLVLHGTSCLPFDQMNNLAQDGVIRVNMWTRIAREAGQYAAEQLEDRMDLVRNGDFEACESRQYLHDSIEKAAQVMEELLHTLGYHKLMQ